VTDHFGGVPKYFFPQLRCPRQVRSDRRGNTHGMLRSESVSTPNFFSLVTLPLLSLKFQVCRPPPEIPRLPQLLSYPTPPSTNNQPDSFTPPIPQTLSGGISDPTSNSHGVPPGDGGNEYPPRGRKNDLSLPIISPRDPQALVGPFCGPHRED